MPSRPKTQALADYARSRCPLPCGHYPAEQAPEETYRELYRFFRAQAETSP